MAVPNKNLLIHITHKQQVVVPNKNLLMHVTHKLQVVVPNKNLLIHITHKQQVKVKSKIDLFWPESVDCFYIDSDSLLFLLFTFSFNSSLRETKFSVHQ